MKGKVNNERLLVINIFFWCSSIIHSFTMYLFSILSIERGKKVSKINDLLSKAKSQGYFDSYREWDIPKQYPFPVYREQKGSLICVYRLDNYEEKFDNKNAKYEKIVDDYQAELGLGYGAFSYEKTMANNQSGKRKMHDPNMRGVLSKKRGIANS